MDDEKDKCTQCGKPLGLDLDGRKPIADPLLAGEGRYCHPYCWWTIINTALKSVSL